MMILETVYTPDERRWPGQTKEREPYRPSATGAAHQLVVEWASCEEDLRQAQRLRYRVFAQEMGARLTPVAGTEPGLDSDAFDPFCDHLLVKARDGNGIGTDVLVGTYRVLPPDAAKRAGGLYIDNEFDLTHLSCLRSKAVELGRSCVDPEWRSGGVILALLTALCQYMFLRRLETMIGCASVGLGDGGYAAEKLWETLRQTHLAASPWRVTPRTPLPLGRAGGLCGVQADTLCQVRTPPLIKGYLRCGARLLGPPALDAAFNTADLPLMLHVDDLAPRYRKRFLGH